MDPALQGELGACQQKLVTPPGARARPSGAAGEAGGGAPETAGAVEALEKELWACRKSEVLISAAFGEVPARVDPGDFTERQRMRVEAAARNRVSLEKDVLIDDAAWVLRECRRKLRPPMHTPQRAFGKP